MQLELNLPTHFVQLCLCDAGRIIPALFIIKQSPKYIRHLECDKKGHTLTTMRVIVEAKGIPRGQPKASQFLYHLGGSLTDISSLWRNDRRSVRRTEITKPRLWLIRTGTHFGNVAEQVDADTRKKGPVVRIHQYVIYGEGAEHTRV